MSEATENAVHFEGIKYAYRQSKDGIVVSFVVHPHEVPAQLSTSNIGARYMVALVEIGDDEQPKKPEPVKAKKEPKDKAEWRDLPPATQAVLRCKDAPFHSFLTETKARELGYEVHEEKYAAEAVRELCGVTSRSELSTNQKARVLWHGLDSEYQAWKQL